MPMYRKPILAALAATMVLAISVTTASAGHLRASEMNFELIWNEAFGNPKTKLEFISMATGANVRCRVTLLGGFLERTIKKETALIQGNINHGELETCGGGTATIRNETFPWPIRYRSFTGTLPRIRSVTLGILRAAFRIRESRGNECEIRSETNQPFVAILGSAAEAPETGLETTGEPENVTAERGNRIALRGEFLCSIGGEGELGGIGLVRNLPRIAKLRITLI